MLPRGRIPPSVQDQHARTEPGSASGSALEGDPGNEVAVLRDGLYRAMQIALDHFPGGVQQLAEDLGAARSDTYLRVARKLDTKGNLQRAFLDFLAPLLVNRGAALAWAGEINKLLDLEPPVPRKQVDDADLGRAWLKHLAALPPGARDGAIADMATALGIRVEDLKAKAGIR